MNGVDFIEDDEAVEEKVSECLKRLALNYSQLAAGGQAIDEGLPARDPRLALAESHVDAKTISQPLPHARSHSRASQTRAVLHVHLNLFLHSLLGELRREVSEDGREESRLANSWRSRDVERRAVDRLNLRSTLFWCIELVVDLGEADREEGDEGVALLLASGERELGNRRVGTEEDVGVGEDVGDGARGDERRKGRGRRGGCARGFAVTFGGSGSRSGKSVCCCSHQKQETR